MLDEEVMRTALVFNVLYRNDAGKLAKIAIISSKKATISDLLELLKCSTQCIACFSTATLHRDKGCIKAAIQHNKQYGYISINDPNC